LVSYYLKLITIGDVGDVVEEVKEAAKCMNLNVVSMLRASAPSNAFDSVRQQYLADRLLEHIARLYRESLNEVLLLVADVDAYVHGLNFVFGIALPYLGAAAVFLPRLRYFADQDRFRRRIRKEVLHELGHVFGLEHCMTPGCVMNFSNSVFDVDAKMDAFCHRCVKMLQRSGVKVDVRCILSL